MQPHEPIKSRESIETYLKAGLNYAVSIFERHVVIESFLTDILNVGKENAHKDACRFEHFVSPETFNKMKEINCKAIKSDD